MKNNLIIASALLIGSFGGLNSVGEKSTNTSGRDEGSKYNVVFEGVLTTQEGHVYKVNEINFNKLIKQIPVFEMPSQESFEAMDKNTHLLKKNPAERLEITKLDLSEISMISVPNPDVLWYYKRNQTPVACPVECSGSDSSSRYKISEDSRASKYIQIQVTDKEGKKENYLVESNKKIYCSEITASGPREKDVQLPAIKTLTITGYRKRDEEKESRTKGVEVKDTAQNAKNALAEKNTSETIKTSHRNKRIRSTKIVRI